MTDDQQFIIAVLTLVVPTVASVLAYRKTDETHKAVNGSQAALVEAANVAGQAVGAADERLHAAGLTTPDPRSTDVPLQRPPAGS